ncbi:hypothetical protein CSHISOI_11719 [Colletotrichum shisoi]|uniref:Uncharacterized protein n=1 Tax=Colletotrichum shisoi TaxID=2078593 RepID=A0A5Q4BAH4_9PEZI|nr:hypothetical protein CSHISOI_11719 [Colletotrichum shisoi]
MRLLLSAAFFVTLLFLGTLARSAPVDENAVAGVSERSDIADIAEAIERRAKMKIPSLVKDKKKDKKKKKKKKKKQCRGQQPAGDESDSDTEDCPTSTTPFSLPTLPAI